MHDTQSRPVLTALALSASLGAVAGLALAAPVLGAAFLLAGPMIKALVVGLFAYSFGVLYGAAHAVEVRRATAEFVQRVP